MTSKEVRDNSLRKSTLTIRVAAVLWFCGFFTNPSVRADQPQQSAFNIKYISVAQVYLDGGSSDGLAVGDTLTVEKDGQAQAVIVVAYVAEHSASCGIVSKSGEISIGDKAILSKRSLPPQVEPTVEPETQAASEPRYDGAVQPEAKAERETTRLSGTVALQEFYREDRTSANLDFSQPTLRLNLTAANLWGGGLALNLRTRTRYNVRVRQYRADVPETEWRNTVYELSLGYGDEQSATSFRAGRIIANKISGVGYIDGLLVQRRMSSRFTAGMFAGTQPQWLHADFQTSLQKLGTYLSFNGGNSVNLTSTVAVAGEYHSADISREFVYVQNMVAFGRWRFYQNADIDINRNWRKAKTGSTFSISNLYASAHLKAASWLGAELTLDDRRNYWTYDTREFDSNLFDGSSRQGFRGRVDIGLPRRLNLNLGGSYRLRELDSDESRSYTLGLRKADITRFRFYSSVSLSQFQNGHTNGSNFSFRLGKYVGRGDNVSVFAGRYYYTYETLDLQRWNKWLGADGYIHLIRGAYISGELRYDRGDDVRGYTVLSSIGYRF